jgi:tetratricopeptide (TPR) repeat protein
VRRLAWRAAVTTVVVLVASFLVAHAARAQDDLGAEPASGPVVASDVPVLSAHSVTDFAVYQGDKVSVEVRATGTDLSVKWMRAQDTLCRQAICEIDTAGLALGTQRLYVVIFNAKGSLFLRYRMRVLAPPAGHQPESVAPPLVEQESQLETVAADELQIKVGSGRGYSYHNKKLEVVGPVARSLEWREKLRTQPRSTLIFGQPGVEQHVLAGSSAAYLTKAESGRRALALAKGVVRSRQLAAKDPRWSIVVGDWLQVDCDSRGDVIVERKGEGDKASATVTVLRGNARVFRRVDVGEIGEVEKGASVTGDAVVIPTGLSARFLRGDGEAVRLVLPDGGRLLKRFVETTPQYMPGRSPVEEREWLISGKDLPEGKDFDEAMAMARSALSTRDGMLALEVLGANAEGVARNANAALALGEAYFLIGLYEAALPWFSRAADLDDSLARPHFLAGAAMLARGEWRGARDELDLAEELGYPDVQLLQYYRGVAAWNIGDRVAARSAITYSLWEDGSEPVTTSAWRYYRRVSSDGWLDLRAFGGVFYDGNAIRGSDDVDLELLSEGPGDDVTAAKGAGWRGAGGFGLWPWRGPGGAAGVTFDVEKRGFFDKGVQALDALDQRLQLVTTLAFGASDDGEEPAVLAVDVVGEAGTTSVGKERAMDWLGGRFAVRSPAFWGLGLRASATRYSDPLPDRADVLDPVRGEPAGPTDRSQTTKGFGLDLAPYDDERFRLAFALDSGSTAYLSEVMQVEDYADQGLSIALGYGSTLRSHYDLGLSVRKRTFKESDPLRADQLTTLRAAWRWQYTTVLHQLLEASYETQSSSEESAAYKRPWFGFGVGLAL